jgi:hypothetical protein
VSYTSRVTTNASCRTPNHVIVLAAAHRNCLGAILR